MNRKATKKIFVHALTGTADQASKFAAESYPGSEILVLSHRELREGGWKTQLRTYRRLRGHALIFYFKSRDDITQPALLLAVHLLHHCQETIIADALGIIDVHTLWSCLASAPRLVISTITDALIFVVSYFALRLLRYRAKSTSPGSCNRDIANFDLAYLFPYPLNRSTAGGAMSHVRGVLGGLKANEVHCEVFTGSPLPYGEFATLLITAGRRKYMFWEAMMLAYNRRFCREVKRALSTRIPRALYQRHGRFMIAGVLLARALQVPLILEYNGSECWTADHWDASRFGPWLRLCEEVSVFGAARIVVVTDASKEELISRGIPDERILVNPNAVDPTKFYPGCGGDEVRRKLGFTPEDVVVTFLGTFGYWHGIEVLQQAALQLLGRSSTGTARICFMLIGHGILHEDIRAGLTEYMRSQRVILTGLIPHDDIPAHLDASDILVSPHVPMPDGKPFFGSPTKLFEYMAMGKAIVASKLDQIAEVLTHNETALLVMPGDADELASAIALAASDPVLRDRLGSCARAIVITRYTWKQNAAKVLESLMAMNAPAVQSTVTGR